MGLESMTGTSVYIDAFINTNPASGDSKGQGDDHLRGIKNCILNTFPNITGAVTSTHTELNILDGATVTTTELNLLASQTAGGIMASGRKVLFYESTAPTGWTQITAVNDKVLRLTSGTGTGQGGSWTLSGYAVDSHTLTSSEIPAHYHYVFNTDIVTDFPTTGMTASNYPAYRNNGDGGDYRTINSGSSTAPTIGRTSSTGSGSGHTHGLTFTAGWRPAYVDVIVCSKD